MNLDECDRIFAEVRRASSPAEACHALEALFAYYKVISIELGRGNIFSRARIANTAILSSVMEMGYPSPALTKAGRLNDANSPCLYAATSIETAIQEIGAAENDFVQIIGFMAKVATPIRIAVIGELHHVQKTGYLRLNGQDPDGSVSRLINGLGIEAGRRLLYVDAFLAGLLGDANAGHSKYLWSRAVASMVFRNADLDGIVFPSVRDTLGMNIAVRPPAADSKVHAVCCIRVRVKKIRDFGFIDYEVIDEADQLLPDGRFSWTERPSAWRRLLFNLTEEEYRAALANPNNELAAIISVYNKAR